MRWELQSLHPGTEGRRDLLRVPWRRCVQAQRSSAPDQGLSPMPSEAFLSLYLVLGPPVN